MEDRKWSESQSFKAPERPFKTPKEAEVGSQKRRCILLKSEQYARERKQGEAEE